MGGITNPKVNFNCYDANFLCLLKFVSVVYSLFKFWGLNLQKLHREAEKVKNYILSFFSCGHVKEFTMYLNTK